MAGLAEADFDAALKDIDDDVLGLVFAACHRALTAQRVDLLDPEDDRSSHDS